MIEMDRFAHKLVGQTIENIERKSVESAATMKDIGMTIEGLELYIIYNCIQLIYNLIILQVHE